MSESFRILVRGDREHVAKYHARQAFTMGADRYDALDIIGSNGEWNRQLRDFGSVTVTIGGTKAGGYLRGRVPGIGALGTAGPFETFWHGDAGARILIGAQVTIPRSIAEVARRGGHTVTEV